MMLFLAIKFHTTYLVKIKTITILISRKTDAISKNVHRRNTPNSHLEFSDIQRFSPGHFMKGPGVKISS
jgi:hypothetical protein